MGGGKSVKAVVIDIKGEYIALLKEDGSIVRRKNKNNSIGDVVHMKDTMFWKNRKIAAAAAACAFCLTILGTGVKAYAAPYYYVSLDVNPSVMLEVNRFDKVISVQAMNEDAENVLKNLELKNKDIEEAVPEIVDEISEAGYFKNVGGEVYIAASAKDNDKAVELEKELERAVENKAAENRDNIEVSGTAVGYEMVQKAKALGMTPGKYNIVTNLLGEEVTEQNKTESVKSLMDRVHAAKGIAVKKSSGLANGTSKADAAAAKGASTAAQATTKDTTNSSAGDSVNGSSIPTDAAAKGTSTADEAAAKASEATPDSATRGIDTAAGETPNTH
jgi:hypothetical protein